MISLPAIFGVSSAVLNTAGLVPYIRDIFLGKTKPERATWWIWLVLNVIAFSAQVAAGSTWSLFMTGAQTVAVGFIAFLSLNHGYGKFKKKDIVSLIIALFGVLLWKFTEQPVAALLLVILVDMLGYYLLIIKTWEAPQTETLIAWVLASIAGFCGVLSVWSLNIPRLIYPIYILIGDVLIVSVIVYRRKVIESKK